MTTTTKLFGELILDEIRKQGLTFSIFAEAERERLCKIESRSELREFYDELGYDCVSVMGSPTEVVRTLKQQRYNSANSRGWISIRKVCSKEYAIIVGVYIASSFLANVLFQERPFIVAASSTIGNLLGGLAVVAFVFLFTRYRNRKRKRLLKMLSEAESF